MAGTLLQGALRAGCNTAGAVVRDVPEFGGGAAVTLGRLMPKPIFPAPVTKDLGLVRQCDRAIHDLNPAGESRRNASDRCSNIVDCIR